MPHRPRLATLALLMAVVPLLLWADVSQAVSNDPEWERKVERSVLSKASSGKADFLIYLTEQADLSGAYRFQTKVEKGRYVYERLTAIAAATQPAITRELDRLGIEHKPFWIVNVIWARGDLGAVERIARRPDVAAIYASGVGALPRPRPEPRIGTLSADATAAVEWNIATVNADDVWALGFTGQGVTVASADTGVEWTHPALKNKYRGWNGTTADHNYNWHDGNPNPANTVCPGPSPEPCDDDEFLGGGHGTHTTGTMVGDDGLGNQVGMAPGARWIACRNMNHGVGVVPTYLACMEWFLAPTDSSDQNADPSKAPDVVNNSWGCVEGCPPPILKAQVESSRAAGIVYAVSAGNDGPVCSTIAFPLAIYEASFTVGATDIADNIADFSSRGPVLTDIPNPARTSPDISAPGVDVRSALKGGIYGELSGTSMAGPHVAGLVALIISANPDLRGNVDKIEQIIQESALHLTTNEACGGDSSTQVPNNTFGWGRIDALAAVRKATMNREPIAVDDAATTEEGTAVTIAVLANDSDPDGDALAVTSVDDPPNGSAVINGDGTVTYTPDAGFTGSDSFDYTISDGSGGTDTATVTVSVNENTDPDVCGEFDDSDKAVEYKTGWHRRTHASASNGGFHRRMGSNNTPNGNGSTPTAKVVFEGDSITYFYVMSNIGGTGDVYIDNVFQETINYDNGQPGNSDSPTFSPTFQRTYTANGSGPHEFKLEHRTGAVYVDGFGFACEQQAQADPAAAAFSSITSVSTASATEGPVIERTVNVSDRDVEVSVVVGDSLVPLTVRLVDPLGNLVASGQALISGLSASGLDAAVSKAGVYKVQVVNVTGAFKKIEISTARTVRN
jgi:serine protease AprX